MKCDCGATSNCVCELPQKMSKLLEKDADVNFLIGLDDSYNAIRIQLLLQTPFPHCPRFTVSCYKKSLNGY